MNISRFTFSQPVRAPAAVVIPLAEEHFKLGVTTTIERQDGDRATTFTWTTTLGDAAQTPTSGGTVTIALNGRERSLVTISGWADWNYGPTTGPLRHVPHSVLKYAAIAAEKREARKIAVAAESIWQQQQHLS